jgi:hypothetical protein
MQRNRLSSLETLAQKKLGNTFGQFAGMPKKPALKTTPVNKLMYAAAGLGYNH